MTPIAPAPRPPHRLIVAGILLVASAGIVVGLIVTTLADMVFFRIDLLFDAPLALLLPGLGWLGYLAYALFRGRRWSRFGVTATMPILVPLYGLFLLILAPMTLADLDYSTPLLIAIRVTAFLLLTAGLLLAVLTPLLLLGTKVTAYLRR